MTIQETASQLKQTQEGVIKSLIELNGGNDGEYPVSPDHAVKVGDCKKCGAGEIMFSSLSIKTDPATNGNGGIKQVVIIATCSNADCENTLRFPVGYGYEPKKFTKRVNIKPTAPKTKSKQVKAGRK
jgi:hypothetical protein